MSHTELQQVTYYSGHVIEVNGKKYVPERTCERTWEHSGPLFDSFKCSECLYEFYEPRCVHGYSDLVANFCPNCGARVKEDE